MNTTCKAVIQSVQFAQALESLATLTVNTNYNMLSDNYKPSLNKQHFLLAPPLPCHSTAPAHLIFFGCFHSLFTLDGTIITTAIIVLLQGMDLKSSLI